MKNKNQNKNKIFLLFLTLFFFFLSGKFSIRQSEFVVLAENNFLDDQKIGFLINKERQKNGLLPLSSNFLLNQAALEKALDMFSEEYFDHQSPSGKNWWQFIKEQNYPLFKGGENLALGFEDEESLIQAFMESQPHRENILKKEFKEIGVTSIKSQFKGKIQNVTVVFFGEQEDVKTISFLEEGIKRVYQFIESNFNFVRTTLFLTYFSF